MLLVSGERTGKHWPSPPGLWSPCHATSQPGTTTPQQIVSHSVGITPARRHLHLLS